MWFAQPNSVAFDFSNSISLPFSNNTPNNVAISFTNSNTQLSSHVLTISHPIVSSNDHTYRSDCITGTRLSWGI
jgi:hypothetical protein